MANRVSVNINANDLTAAGIRSVRAQVNHLRRSLPNRHTITVSVRQGASAAEIRRLNEMIRSLPNGVRVRVRMVGPGPDDENRIRRVVTRSVTSPFRLLGGVISGTLSDGVGQGIIQGVRSGGPIAAGLFVALIVAALAAAGAAIAGALVLGLGGAVAGLGIFLAAQSGIVKKQWHDTLEQIKDDFSHAAEPMLPVIEGARRKLLRLALDFVPHFRNTMLEMQGPLNTFIEHMSQGLRKLLDIAGPDLTEAFNTFLIAFGPQFEEWFEQLGRALAALARTVRDNSTEIALALRIVLNLLIFMVNVVNFLANVWADSFHHVVNLIAGMADAMAFFVEMVLNGFDQIIGAAEAAFGWIPGVGEDIRAGREAFRQFKDGLVSDLRTSADSIRGISQAVKDTNAKNKLTADISALNAKIEDAKRRLNTVRDKKTQAKIKAEISQLIAARDKAVGILNSLNGRTATMNIITYSKTYRSVHDIVGKATGGMIGAASGGPRSNLTLVGEQGPELVHLPAGSRVRSNPDTRSMLGGGAQVAPLLVQLLLDGRVVAEQLVEPQRDLVRKRAGGDVQRFYGKGKAR